MSVGVEVLIQHHPKRAHLLPPLLARIPGARVVEDPDPTGYPSPWRTYRRCLLEPVVSTHRLIVQDDVEVCDDFLEVVHRVVAARSNSAIVLFVGGVPYPIINAMETACHHDQPFAAIPGGTWLPAVAVVWPARMLAPIVAHSDAQNWPEYFTADDEILGRCVNALGFEAVATVPSLVEHPDRVDSVVAFRRAFGGEDPGRVAWCFVDGDPLAIDWK